MDNENYISPNKITKQYDITSGTLRRWSEAGKIRCLRPNGGKRIYNIDDIEDVDNIVKLGGGIYGSYHTILRALSKKYIYLPTLLHQTHKYCIGIT